MNSSHIKFINQAHNIASRHFGSTFPNPVVGCIIAKNNKIISKGVTFKSGRPHAEEVALKKAGTKAKGASMYVTLEPCFHNSINGSCSDQILRAGIKEIFISSTDPDKRTNGKSIKKFKLNKIVTNTGIQKKKTLELNKFFFISLKTRKPYTKVKMAISNDEKIAWHDYSSKWISNSVSRIFAHKIREKSQAILTTSKTIIKDNPRLTIRKKNKETKHLPIIVIDRNLKIPFEAKILKDRYRKRIIIFTSKKNNKMEKIKQLGCEIEILKKNKNGMLSLNKIFYRIYKLKIRDVLVEAGGIFFTNLLKNNLVNEFHLFRANFNIGKNGKPMLIKKQFSKLNLSLINKKKFRNNFYYKYYIR